MTFQSGPLDRKAGYTDVELAEISRTPEAWEGITWYRESRLPWRKGFRVVGNPFGPG